MDPLSLMMGIGGIGASLFGQSNTNQMQMQMMQQQQAFQERMSSTAYQRASTDMQAAGLNPMMMFSSGSAASTPSGASPSPAVKSGLDADSMQKAISTAVNARVANATIDNLVEQNAKIKAETRTEGVRPALLAEQAGVARGESNIKRATLPVVENAALTAENERRMNSTARRLLDQGAYGGKKASDTLSPVSDLLSSAKHARSVFSDRFYY